MNEKTWRFPSNNYTNENGLDTSDMETFKKDPVSSLAREICQNSIDAASSKKPVIVEFSLFRILRDSLPDVNKLSEQIFHCYKYVKEQNPSSKELPALMELEKSIEKNIITCLRVSDFNTTGAVGAATNDRGTPFYNLTKGSGVSDKSGSCGGSKGIGKFASFVVSTTNTVFYSTKAIDGSCAHIGISKLRSAPIPGCDPDLLTMGIGYYGIGEKNSPILEEVHLDSKFSRGVGEYGTDVYIIGFHAMKGWENEIIAKVLESFMVAVIRGELEVKVGDIVVNKNTVKNIIYDEDFQSSITPTEIRDIKAQYELLQDNTSVTVKEIQIDENNSVTVYLKQYGQQNEADATKHCVMVRYPFMKITYIRPGAYIPYSALCVIPDNDLNKNLREIENPQHTDWEIKRLNDFPAKKKETRKLMKALEKSVTEFITSVLRESSCETTDIEGAGEFLPSQEDSGNFVGNIMTGEQVSVRPITRVKVSLPKTEKAGEDGESFTPYQGEITDNGENGNPIGISQNLHSNPSPQPNLEQNEHNNNVAPGKLPILTKVPLSGMRYHTIITDKDTGKYDCIFTSLYNENDCEFSILLRGDHNKDKFKIKIISASINGQPCTIQDGKIVGIKIEKKKKYKISYSVNSSEIFASEVILNANR